MKRKYPYSGYGRLIKAYDALLASAVNFNPHAQPEKCVVKVIQWRNYPDPSVYLPIREYPAYVTNLTNQAEATAKLLRLFYRWQDKPGNHKHIRDLRETQSLTVGARLDAERLVYRAERWAVNEPEPGEDLPDRFESVYIDARASRAAIKSILGWESA